MVKRDREPPQETSKLDRHLFPGGSMNKCDVNLTVKPAARGIEGKELRKRKGLGLAHPSRGHFSQFLLPKPRLCHRPLQIVRFQGRPHPGNHEKAKRFFFLG